MRVTYDPKVDAAYIYLAKKVAQPETRQVDEDIALDFDASGKLVGIEVLDASQRLDLKSLLPLKQSGHSRASVPVTASTRKAANGR